MDLDRPEHMRRPLLALAAKLLVGLGFAVALLLIGGEAAQAADRPTRKALGPVKEVTEKVTHPARAIEAARTRPAEAPRSVRVAVQPPAAVPLPTTELHLDRERVEVAGTPAIAGHVVPVRLHVPRILPALPSVDLVVGGPSVQRPDRTQVAGQRPAASTPAAPAPAEPARSTKPMTERAATPAPETSPARPDPVRQPAGSTTGGQLPTPLAAASGLALAVLGSVWLRAPAHAARLVHTALSRVPVAPSFEPSFTPD